MLRESELIETLRLEKDEFDRVSRKSEEKILENEILKGEAGSGKGKTGKGYCREQGASGET